MSSGRNLTCLIHFSGQSGHSETAESGDMLGTANVQSSSHPVSRDNTDRLKICSFESRRGEEMASLIERMGALATIAPSMREIPLGENPEAFRFGERLLNHEFRLMVFLTGVGARALLEVLETRFPREEILAAWDRCVTIVRGPKPHAVLREWGVHVDARAPEPNTWRELLSTLDDWGALQSVSMAVQEYGQPNELLYEELQQRGAMVTRVPVYRWALPEDLNPLEHAIRTCVQGEFDALLWTSAQQVHHVLEVADRMGLKTPFLQAANRCVIGSIGPTATETLIEQGLAPDLEPEHPKMGPLVKLVCEAGLPIVARKQLISKV